MTLGVRLLASGGKNEFHHWPSPVTKEPTLITLTPAQAHGHFKSANRTTTGTTVVVQPKSGLSIYVTDIIISGEKQAGSYVIVRFTDGVNTEVVVRSDQVDATPVGPGPLTAYFRGWKDARVEMFTGGAGDATVTIGYIHSSDNPSYAEWDAAR